MQKVMDDPKTTTYAIDGNTKSGSIYGVFDTLVDAETRAREVCRATGCSLFLVEQNKVRPRIVATVRQDNAGRVWTDVAWLEGNLL
jgi:hypothetical protein